MKVTISLSGCAVQEGERRWLCSARTALQRARSPAQLAALGTTAPTCQGTAHTPSPLLAMAEHQ